MFKKQTSKKLDIHETLGTIPHCDQRVLHAPGECEHCDKHPDWQALRQLWGIAFTGWEPEVKEKELPDPATYARGFQNLNAWGGNKARPIHNHLGGTHVSGCPACINEGGLS